MKPVPEPIKNASTDLNRVFKLEDQKFKIEEIEDTKYGIKKENLPEDETILKTEDNLTKTEHVEPKVEDLLHCYGLL